MKVKKGEIMSRLWKSLLWTGIYLLQKRDKGVEPVCNPMWRRQRRLKGEDHTLLYVLTFAAGVGVGWGWGFSAAAATGQEPAGRIRRTSDRVTSSILSEGNMAVAG
jgi:hypothetical protein